MGRQGAKVRLRRPAGRLVGWWLDLTGGPVRARVILLLACVLALDTADLGSVGAIAGKLEHALSLSNTQLGLLAATPSICSALITLPMGILVDRTNRVRLVWITMLLWSAGEALGGFSPSFQMLLVVRVGLGAATAVATPAVASLVGDLFPGGERGRIWGLILGGELVGAAFGYLIAGEAAALGAGSWRYAFYVLAVPSLLGALAVRAGFPSRRAAAGVACSPEPPRSSPPRRTRPSLSRQRRRRRSRTSAWRPSRTSSCTPTLRR